MSNMHLLWWLCIYSSGPKINRDLNSANMQILKFYLEKVVIYHVDSLKMGQILSFKLNFILKVPVNSPIKH